MHVYTYIQIYMYQTTILLSSNNVLLKLLVRVAPFFAAALQLCHKDGERHEVQVGEKQGEREKSKKGGRLRRDVGEK